MRSDFDAEGAYCVLPQYPMNLATHYLGLKLCSPFVIGASPFCDSTPLARKLQDAGAGALVMRSIFEEQIDPPPRRASREMTRSSGSEEFPEVADYQLSPESYLQQLTQLKKEVSIPVIASLNGARPGVWTNFATQLEQAGADAIELNFYRVVTDVGIAADQVESDMLETVGLIARAVRIPVAVKLSPYHTALAQLAVALELAGADGVVVFNRFYQPDVNTTDLEVQTHLRLSDPEEIMLRLRWLAILSPHLRGSLAATGGFQTADHVIKALLTGAHVVQLVSTLLRYGPPVIATMTRDLRAWMEGHGYATIDEFCGRLNLRGCRDAAAFERANYIRTLQSWKV
jgi:dihydroorotate dehydrogenase (fumarate)